MTRPTLTLFDQAVASWLRSMSPVELEALAVTSGSIEKKLLQWDNPVAIAMARMALGKDGVASLARLTDADFLRMLDYLLAAVPEQAVILWQHESWYISQMRAVRDTLLARLR